MARIRWRLSDVEPDEFPPDPPHGPDSYQSKRLDYLVQTAVFLNREALRVRQVLEDIMTTQDEQARELTGLTAELRVGIQSAADQLVKVGEAIEHQIQQVLDKVGAANPEIQENIDALRGMRDQVTQIGTTLGGLDTRLASDDAPVPTPTA